MRYSIVFLLLNLIFLCQTSPVQAQTTIEQDTIPHSSKGFLTPSDNYNKVRFYSMLGGGIAAYSATLYGLSQAWYNQYDKTSFHFYDDFGVWQHMDKYGHAYTTYFYTDILHRMTLWTGMNDNSSLWLAAGGANLFQLTLEILDGFNEEWGFSISDIGANVSGSAIYVAQHLLWKEQRIRIKFSSLPPTYSNDIVPSINNMGTITYKERAQELYGRNLSSKILKDYNGQTYWLSFNPASFNIPHPKWLNWSFGIGSEDMYAGKGNEWITDNIHYRTPFEPRQVFYLSPDVNWDAFRGKNEFINTILGTLNYIKTPLPAISVDSRGNFQWHLVFF